MVTRDLTRGESRSTGPAGQTSTKRGGGREVLRGSRRVEGRGSGREDTSERTMPVCLK